LEAGETAEQHVHLVSCSVFNPASRLEEHEISLVFFLAPTAGFSDQKSFTYQSNWRQAPLMIMK
jgi:hypothetical protein